MRARVGSWLALALVVFVPLLVGALGACAVAEADPTSGSRQVAVWLQRVPEEALTGSEARDDGEGARDEREGTREEGDQEPGSEGGEESAARAEAELAAPAAGEAAATVQASATATACSPAWGSFHIGNWPSGCWRPYGPTSPFNFVIPPTPKLSSQSTAIISYMRHHRWTFEHNEAGNFTWDDGGSRPLYWPTSTDPLVTVTCRSSTLCQAGMKLRIPAGAQPEEGSDAHMTVMDQEHGREYDFWKATKPEKGAMTTTAGKSIPIGAESGTGLEGDAEAADLGLAGGLVRAAELSAGKIEHALVTTVKCVQLHDVWPSPASATGDAICPYERLGPRFASLLQLNMTEAEIAATNAPRWQQTIMKAMARYGVYIVDTQNSTSMYLLSEDDRSFTSFGYTGQMDAFVKSQGSTNHHLAGVPIATAKLRVIDPCVPQKTC